MRREYCLICRPPKPKSQARKSDDVAYCQLPGCNRKIPPTRGGLATYCSKRHAQVMSTRRYQEKKKRETSAKAAANRLFKAVDQKTYVPQERQGEVYERLKSDSLTLEMLLSGQVTASAVAVQMNVSTAAVTRSMQAILSERAIQNQRDLWSQSQQVKAMLPRNLMLQLKEVEPDGELFNTILDILVRSYSVFSRRYFKLEGRRPLIMGFHLKWIRSIIRAWAIGGKQLILSPPRHGKSEMLIRFVVWFIVMDPNIRIGWFCASRDVAELMLGAVKDHLENNEELIRDTLPPGQLFNPGLKSGKPWSAKEIKVAQQSHVGQKSSSLLALGLTSKFLSRDMDLIIIDDPEDFDSTNEEGQRKKARNKLAEIGTRKEEHTAEVFISSRQHPDDIPNHLLATEGTPQAWDIIVDTAHDPDCSEDPDDWDAHYECMLFPQVRSYRWLMEKKFEMESLGVPHAYPMRYLNNPVPADGQVFDVETIRDVALNRERGIGLEGLPLGHLVAGLDPSARGIQASFLWHYRETGNRSSPVKMAMVDSDAMQSGGVQGAINIIIEWRYKYELRSWFYETNSQQIEFYKLVKDGVNRRMMAEFGFNDIVIKEHSTGKNKQDAELGISAMAPLYHSGAIDLPYGTHEARQKVNYLLRQLELWTTDGVDNRKAKTDIKMAQWFPFVGKIQSFIKQKKAVQPVVQQEGSYQGIDRFATVPWGNTAYPGG